MKKLILMAGLIVVGIACGDAVGEMLDVPDACRTGFERMTETRKVACETSVANADAFPSTYCADVRDCAS